ncbi:oligoribonuclease [Candidatus Saccharibacteria bacterium]|nr:oligoribonuclease [Candidatus Saccharibacteria bacterium]MBR3233517.1 oligoribonuclease [Candidatus Saccharibacteria bacterium]
MSKKATLLWIDLEMTGLIPGKDKILEVAAIATDWKLDQIAEYTGIVKVPENLMSERMVGPFWEKNSDSRDALIAQNTSGKPVKEIEKELLEFITANFAKQSIADDEKGKGKIILAGNSIHQDRKFIDIEMPELAERLHYRMLDVSAWKVYFEGALGKKFLKPEVHRALDDIEGSIEELKWYLTFMK